MYSSDVLEESYYSIIPYNNVNVFLSLDKNLYGSC